MKFSQIVLVAVCVTCVTQIGTAQSAQKFSFQGSALREDGWGEAFEWRANDAGNCCDRVPGGYGAEAQLRYNGGSAISWGLGVQWTQHTWTENSASDTPGDWKASLIGVFLEPRYVLPVGGSGFAPYLSARLAVTRESLKWETEDIKIGHAIGQTVNGGGGVLIRIAPRVNLDLGATFGYTHYGDFECDIDGCTSEDNFPNGTGTNLITRIGLAFGLGR